MAHGITDTLVSRNADHIRPSQPVSGQALDRAVVAAREAILALQHDDGHWCHPLETDCSIPAEYVLMLHYLGEREPATETGIGHYLRRWQQAEGGWALYHGGAMDISATVKAYWALKLIGDDIEADHMRRAREAILAHGGAARANVFTRISMALFEQVPWRATPVLPVELVLLPKWFPVSLLSISYWSRTVIVPLSILCSLKPRAANPLGLNIRELFTTPPEDEQNYFTKPESGTARLFMALDKISNRLQKLLPPSLRKYALKRAEQWIVPRLNGVDGLGAIFPAMINSLEALALLGHDMQAQPLSNIRQGLRNLITRDGHETYCQPCLSPVWDTALTCLALETDHDSDTHPQLDHAIDKAVAWLCERQLINEHGDWAATHPRLQGGGWAFQYNNGHYPDLDDTAAVTWAIHRSARHGQHDECIQRAADWLVGMASRNGGYGAYDANNNRQWLNDIPFADHGALLDPPTSDVSARVLMLLACLGRPQDRATCRRLVTYLCHEQEKDGSWFGRWGTNYIYGTWSVLMAMEMVVLDTDNRCVHRAVDWLIGHQRSDGSWGETNDTYLDPSMAGCDASGHPVQTAWALLGLMAAGRADSDAVRRGVAWLIERQDRDGAWHDPCFNAPGFPRVLYLKYHGYGYYFPYWALARYRRESHTRHSA